MNGSELDKDWNLVKVMSMQLWNDIAVEEVQIEVNRKSCKISVTKKKFIEKLLLILPTPKMAQATKLRRVTVAFINFFVYVKFLFKNLGIVTLWLHYYLVHAAHFVPFINFYQMNIQRFPLALINDLTLRTYFCDTINWDYSGVNNPRPTVRRRQSLYRFPSTTYRRDSVKGWGLVPYIPFIIMAPDRRRQALKFAVETIMRKNGK